MAESFVPRADDAISQRWDREWMHYFATEEKSAFLRPYTKMSLNTEFRGQPASAVFDLVGFDEAGASGSAPMRIWVDGDRLVGKRVLEIGCGCGWLGKRIGMIGGTYLGLDYSEVALAIARGVSPSGCTYAHISDSAAIEPFLGTMDVLVGREFFIHQNYENATWVLKLGSSLLRSGGVISADFYRGNPDIEQGVVHPAKSPLDPEHASCAFEFSDADIQELAADVGLTVLGSERHLAHQRQFVTFAKP